MKNPINGVPFGQERTAKEHRDRAEWEHDQAAQLRVQKHPVGYEHIAQGHEDAARSYERRAKEIESGMVTTARQGEARGKSRAELVDVARAAAAAVFAPRKVAPSEAAIKKARNAAFKAIQRHDRFAGTADHPVAAYSHGIAELAAEATEEARQRWQMHHERLRKSGRSSHSTIASTKRLEPCDSFEPCHGNYACCIHAASTPGTMEYKRAKRKARAKPRGSSHATIATRDYEYVVYPETSHRHAERAVKIPTRRGKGPYDLTDAKRAAKQMGSPASIYSVSKGRFVGYVHPSGRYVTFR